MDEASPERPARKATRRGLYALGGLAVSGAALWVAALSLEATKTLAVPLAVLGGTQLLVALAVVVVATVGLIRRKRPEPAGLYVGGIVGALVLAFFGLAGAVFGAIMGSGGLYLGGAWGRPLRLRGKSVQPALKAGTDWARGDRPDPTGLDARHRTLLAALWLRDAQKEHASVPAFARIGWVLTALGAPAELVEDAHRSALQEIDHARRCFALAAGYAGETRTVEPMPELLRLGLALEPDALRQLALESLRDGCLTEDFNADLAALAAERAVDPAARALAARIARDEREHAEVSWRILGWCLERGTPALRDELRRAAQVLPVDGPTAFAHEHRPLLPGIDLETLADHGRVRPERWAPRYAERVELTRARLEAMLDGSARAAA